MKDKLTEGLTKIRSVLDIYPDSTNGDELTGKLNELTNIMGLAAEMEATAKGYLYQEKLRAIGLIKHNKDKPSIQKEILDGECHGAIELLCLAERYGRSISHASENLRTQISLLKEEIKLGLK